MANPKHGHGSRKGRTPTNNSYWSMRHRCLNPNHEAYYRYGGAGISICDRWLGDDGFINFLADMGERPKGLTLDRIDNSKGYSPENCRWATLKEQNDNRKSNKLTDKQIRIIRWAYHFGTKQKDLIKIFNISQSHINNIVNNKRR